MNSIFMGIDLLLYNHQGSNTDGRNHDYRYIFACSISPCTANRGQRGGNSGDLN
ncbi:MAG: hypothetical protein H7A37_02620 [Chlamydiales bacterium]|nr:hypothetical protein [Chlamydiales bacterium]